MKNIDYYKSLNYPVTIQRHLDESDQEYFTAEILILNGCKADGSTPYEAHSNLMEMFDSYIEACINMGANIAEPVVGVIKFPKSYNRISEISRLGHNWDGFGSPPISWKAIKKAYDILEDIGHEPTKIHATLYSGIDLWFKFVSVVSPDMYSIFTTLLLNVDSNGDTHLSILSDSSMSKLASERKNLSISEINNHLDTIHNSTISFEAMK